MTAVTAEQMAEWKALTEKATPEPWQAWRIGNAPILDGTLVGQSRLVPVPRPYNPHWIGYQNEASALEHHHSTILCDEDADFVAAARTAVPALLAEVERLRATVIKLCNEFEDATYDTNSGGQSIDRKNLIAECRRAALEDGT